MAKIKAQLEDFIPDARFLDERGATPERAMRAGIDYDRGDTGTVTMRDSPVERAGRRGILNDSQCKAAVKFYNHWYRSGMAGQFGSINLSGVFGGDFGFSGMARSEVEQFHRERYRKAVNSVGRRGAWVLDRVVCREISFEEAGNELGWRHKPQAMAAAIQLTRDALEVLVDDWGLR